MYRLLLLNLVILTGTIGCSHRQSPAMRPNGVPESAVWVGGADGGAFIDCTYLAATRLDFCTVYNDGTGDVWMKGTFHLHGTDHGIPLSPSDYDYADGRAIGLTSNKGYLEQ